MTKTATAPAPRKATAAERKATQAALIKKLVTEFHAAQQSMDNRDKSYEEAMSILEAAKLERSNARVLMGRAAYRLATAPGVVKADGTPNQSGAAKHIGENRTTLRHHILAGAALAKKNLILNTGKPTEAERAVVEASHDKTSREAAREARERKAAKEAAKLEAVATAAATGDVQAMADLMPGKSGDVVTVQAAESATTATEATTATDAPAESTAITFAEILAKLDTVASMVAGFRNACDGFTQGQLDTIEDKLSAISVATGAGE